ncbi:MAG TPA: alkaline phosphatase family protein [Methylomirabilota bacterium]|nr:alkaline phosphatase family protein [Methylomirabilota bacterium]
MTGFRPDELILFLQNLFDRSVRRLRLGAPPSRNRRRLLIVQIDGLSRSVLEEALSRRRMPFLKHLLGRHRYRVLPMSVGLPTSTPAFQIAAMYGVRPNIPAFHYYDKRSRTDIYFPRGGDALLVEKAHAGGRRGILSGGSAYGCVFTGGAENNLFSFARIQRPSGTGVLRTISAFIVLGWVVLKGSVFTAVELTRAVLRWIANPFSVRGWKWLAIKMGISVWVRELFTLATSRDLYEGVPAVYVNYLDYDVAAHEFGPRHRRAQGALRQIDRSIHQLWRVCRRVTEHQYDLYILSDHGQAATTPYQRVTGKPIEQMLFDELFRPWRGEPSASGPSGKKLIAGVHGYRSGRAPGLFQRFVNYLERDFPWVLGEVREARERSGVRVIAAGPNALVYFLDCEEPVTIDWIDERFPGLVEEISRSRGIGFVLARSSAGPICAWRGKRHSLSDAQAGPFTGREDLALVFQGIRDLMEMPSAGDLIIYGIHAPEGDISFISEWGAHAGPSPDELHTFIISPPGVTLPSPITHPIQLYQHFLTYQNGLRTGP